MDRESETNTLFVLTEAIVLAANVIVKLLLWLESLESEITKASSSIKKLINIWNEVWCQIFSKVSRVFDFILLSNLFSKFLDFIFSHKVAQHAGVNVVKVKA